MKKDKTNQKGGVPDADQNSLVQFDARLSDAQKTRTLKIALEDENGNVAERVIGNNELKSLVWGKSFDFVEEVNRLSLKLNVTHDGRGD